MDIIRRIRDCIKNSDMTQKEISAKLGISEDSMVRYLKGTSQFKLDMLIKLSEILQISIVELISEEKPIQISEENLMLIEAYNNADAGTQGSVRKLLDLPQPAGKSSTSTSEKEAI